jgi:type VI secretion system protein ImpB
MAKETSVAPKERVNIVYKAAIGDAQEEVELPLKIVMMGDYTLREDDRELEDRKPISVDKDNFKDVMKSMELGLVFNIPNRLSEKGDEAQQLSVNLKPESLKDFGPESIVEQVPELNKLLQLRIALQALKGPLGNIPAFRKKIEGLIADRTARDRLLTELSGGRD